MPDRPDRRSERPEGDDDAWWGELIGPVYTPAGLARVLGVTEADVDVLVSSREVIAFWTSDGHVLLPSWQMIDSQIDPAMLRVWQALRATADDLTCLQWMCSAVEALGDVRPVDWIRAGRDPKPALAAAERIADWWSR